MRSFTELKAIREHLGKSDIPKSGSGTKIVVGMGTCGIAAGARSVMLCILDELATRNLQDIAVTQTGCIGMCEKEPLLEVVVNGNSTLYAYVNSEKVKRIVLEHVVNNVPVSEWVVTKQ